MCYGRFGGPIPVWVSNYVCEVPVVQTANLFSFSITSLVQLIEMG